MRKIIDALLAAGEMRVVEREVDPCFELAAVVARSQQESDRPILFKRVKGSRFGVVSNLFGSRPRLGSMIGLEKGGSFYRHWEHLMTQPGQPLVTVDESALPGGLEAVAMSELPHIHYHEKDAGAYITAGIFLAKDPETAVPNLSFHRCLHISDEELRVRLGTSHDLTRYQAKAEAMDKPLEAAILLGPPPEFALAAAAPIPPQESELDVVARLSREPVPMRRCRTIDLEVPLETEVVIEGRILPHVRRPEAPFGEFLGYYVPETNNHVFEITAVVVRPDAYFHGLVCGSPEDHRLLEVAFASQIFQHLNKTCRGIIDVACVPNVMNVVVKINQQYEGHARQVLLSAFGVNHDFTKSCMVVDEDVDINDLNDVYWAFLTRGRVDKRVFTLDVPGFYGGRKPEDWGRIAIDATMPLERKHLFERKRIPGLEAVDLKAYFG
ncbi:MAG: UbiD family decarboxylase [Anaerolineales bacterium]|nr:UbiD family decarboxylase [Anaerolineales bacterium]